MFKSAAKEAAAVDGARNRLLSTFAHELNNLLTPIMLELELLGYDTKHPLPPRHAKAIAVIQRNTRRLAKLVADLRDVGQIQTDGGLRLRRADVDLDVVVQYVVESYRSSAAAAGIDPVIVAELGLVELVRKPFRLTDLRDALRVLAGLDTSGGAM